jgi:hypothetical protein
MQYQATLHFSEALMKKAVRAFWWRLTGWKYIVTVLLLGIGLFFLDQKSWYFNIVAIIVYLGCILPIMVYISHYRNGMKKFKAVKDHQVIMTAEEETFTLQSALGHSTLKWSAIQKVWQYPEFWLIFYSKAQFNTLPIRDISPDMQQFIQQQIVAVGGKIK